MGRTGMPEAAVYEDDDSCTDEDDIGSSPHSRQNLPVDTETKSMAVKEPAEGHFGSSIPLSCDLHTVENFR
jgi:hypothetical protein